MKKLGIFILGFLLLINVGFSEDLFSCRVASSINPSSVCDSSEKPIFYLNKNFFPISNPAQVLSSKISLNFDSNYNRAICCKITKPNLGVVDFDTTILSSQNCPTGTKELLYFTSTYNAKIGYPNTSGFNKLEYSNKLCVKLPKQFSSLDILLNETDYSYAGYTCLFRTNLLQNSLVSSCSAKFSTTQNYKYTVWARLFEDNSALKCSSDCTSKLDNRVYSSCGAKIAKCKAIPKSCDGSLLNSWVKLDNTRDVKCSPPWNIYKSQRFTNQTISIKTIDENKCLNLIKKKYSVILNNELVTMNIYVCNN